MFIVPHGSEEHEKPEKRTNGKKQDSKEPNPSSGDMGKQECSHATPMSKLLEVVQEAFKALGQAVEALREQHERELAGLAVVRELKPETGNLAVECSVETCNITGAACGPETDSSAAECSPQVHFSNVDEVSPSRNSAAECSPEMISCELDRDVLEECDQADFDLSVPHERHAVNAAMLPLPVQDQPPVQGELMSGHRLSGSHLLEQRGSVSQSLEQRPSDTETRPSKHGKKQGILKRILSFAASPETMQVEKHDEQEQPAGSRGSVESSISHRSGFSVAKTLSFGKLSFKNEDSTELGADFQRCASTRSSRGRIDPKACWLNPPKQSKKSVASKTSYNLAPPRMPAGDIGETDVFQDPSSALQVCMARCTLTPTQSFRICWDLFAAFIIAFDMVTIPLSAFAIPEHMFFIIIDWTGRIFWSVDVPFTFFVGYHSKKDGGLVMHPQKIAWHYFTTWFLLDLLLVGASWISVLGQVDESYVADAEVSGIGRTMRAARVLRMLKLLRLFKLRMLFGHVSELLVGEFSHLLFRLTYQVSIVVFMNHVVACLWFWVADTLAQDYDNTWVDTHLMKDSTIPYQYISSLHWSLTQFTPATQNIFPHSPPERSFAVLVVLWSIVTFATFVGGITNTVTQLRNIGAQETREFNLLRRYLGQEYVKKSLQRRIIKWLEYAYRNQKKHLSPGSLELLKLLSDPLRNELHYDIVSQYIRVHTFFAFLQQLWSPLLLRVSLSACVRHSYAPRDAVFSPGDEGAKMYFIVVGLFSYTTLDEHDMPQELDPPLKAGEWASEHCLWIDWIHCGELSGHASCKSAETIAIEANVFNVEVSRNIEVWHEARKYSEMFASMLNCNTSDCETDILRDYDVGDFATKASLRRASSAVSRLLPKRENGGARDFKTFARMSSAFTATKGTRQSRMSRAATGSWGRSSTFF